jgi:hypothetical protein
MTELQCRGSSGDGAPSHTPLARMPLRSIGAMSCADARQLLREDGYRNVVARECDAKTYVFGATHGGRHVVLRVNSRNGHVRPV